MSPHACCRAQHYKRKALTEGQVSEGLSLWGGEERPGDCEKDGVFLLFPLGVEVRGQQKPVLLWVPVGGVEAWGGGCEPPGGAIFTWWRMTKQGERVEALPAVQSVNRACKAQRGARTGQGGAEARVWSGKPLWMPSCAKGWGLGRHCSREQYGMSCMDPRSQLERRREHGWACDRELN